jgi:cobalt-zinc-cadmium efflux system membrane fusion protein
MIRTTLRGRGIAVVLIALLAAGCGRGRGADGHESGHAGEAEHAGEHHDGPTGPHGGRELVAPGIRLELLLSGEEGPPAFTGWLHDGEGRPLRPTHEILAMTLERLGGRRETVAFRIDGDHFHSTTSIPEPHSFRAVVSLRRGTAVHRWSFEQSEGRIELPAEAIRTAGIETGVAGPAAIEVTIEAPGEVRLNSQRTVQIRPRFPGQVRELRRQLGDAVRSGEVLATVHGNESLAEYAITAPTSGTIVGQEASVGQAVDHESALYTIADLTSVWVDFPIYPQNAGRIRTGQRVRVRSESGPPLSGLGAIRYVGPLLEQDTRVSYGRVVLDNRDRRWQPGLYVACAVTVEDASVPIAVPEEAIVRLRDGPAVFRAEGGRFEPQPVVVGRSDGRTTEIVAGLEAGARVVVRKAFLLKAELGKGEAGHAH